MKEKSPPKKYCPLCGYIKVCPETNRDCKDYLDERNENNKGD